MGDCELCSAVGVMVDIVWIVLPYYPLAGVGLETKGRRRAGCWAVWRADSLWIMIWFVD
jgi:hypothetical protein